MPRFRQTSEILRLMRQKEKIRNVGIIAHIDHGKTTMTDSFLVQAGLLPSQIAGQARALDYLEQEQKRGITIKTANISLLHQTSEGQHVINIVDTPGHVDFTGKVARAMRAVDGAVIVVDAVEEVMAQTETVTRQALHENVKPVLFINKIDRLIGELGLAPDEIQSKFARIINDVNGLIEQYAEASFKKEWKVNASAHTVAFGSALHRWGFTLDQMKNGAITFSDVIKAYRNQTRTRLPNILPLHRAILNMIIQHLPSPLEAQKYRIGRIWKGNAESELGQALLNCNENGPLAVCITNVQLDPRAGSVATGRVFSGIVKPGMKVFLCNLAKEQEIAEASIYMGSYRESVAGVEAGTIVALTGLNVTQAGETITDAQHTEQMVPFESFTYASEPVMTVTVEPRNPKDLPLVVDALQRLEAEDPNLRVSINEHTGEYRLSGIGELHLETSFEFLKNRIGAVDVVTSPPTVDYREEMTRKGSPITAVSSDKLNTITVQAEPIATSENGSTDRVLVTEDGNILVEKREAAIPHIVRDPIIEGFRWACRTGPLCEEPLRNVRARLLRIDVVEEFDLQEPAQVARTVSRAMMGSFLTGGPVLLEPICKIEISVPTVNMGATVEILAKREARIVSSKQKDFSTIIEAFISAEATLGLAQKLRSATSGRAFWESSFDHWQAIPPKTQSSKIAEIRLRRGLASEIPKPGKFGSQLYGE